MSSVLAALSARLALQLSVCPLWTLRPPTCRSGIGISCPTLESKLSAQQRCKSPYIILPTLPYSSTSNFLYLCPITSSQHGWDQTGKLPPPSRQRDLSQGGQPCFCVSKVRLPCRMLSFSGWWLWGGHGWQHQPLRVMREAVWKDED